MNSSPLESIQITFQKLLKEGASHEVIQNTLVGRKGLLPEFLRTLPTYPVEDRKKLGSEANTLRQQIESHLEQLTSKNIEEMLPLFDKSLPALKGNQGAIHPVTSMIQEMVGIFADLSFEVVEGPEIVTDTDNFENLNLGKDHPARDGHDSFFLSDSLLLRTQTTAVQVLEMKKRFKSGQLPIRVVVPGKTYRRESDQTHSAMFHQIDAVVVDTSTTFSDLRGSLDYFAKRLFGDTVETRFRPHHFPFTEPSAEMDIKLKNALGTGRHTQWLEFGGCGMIHPDVLKRAGLNPKIYRGWAFGMSIERPVMVRYEIPDLRLLFQNDPAFLSQFSSQSC